MYFKKRQMTDSVTLNRLIFKRDQTFSEVHELNEEIAVIRSIIKSKHQSIQKISAIIIERQKSLQHLRLASSCPRWKVTAKGSSKKREQREFSLALVADNKDLVGRQ